MATQAHDARIDGDGTVPAGSYGTITLNGGGTLSGDVQCRRLVINGAGHASGAVTAGAITVNGAATFGSTVQAGELTVNGSCDVHGSAGIGRLAVAGRCAISGGLAAHDVSIKGDLSVGADLECRELTGEGRIRASGRLVADSIDLALHGRSTVAAAQSRRMVVRAPEGITALLSAFADRAFVAESIDGEDLELVDVHAKVVRARRATLGRGCCVGLVEYRDDLNVLSDASVEERRQVASP